jgi:hypothetical protein
VATAQQQEEGGFKFPHEADDTEVSLDAGDNIEVEVVDDTPPRDRGRKPLDREVVDPTDEEIEQVSKNVGNRIKELTRARHDERRARETIQREKEELTTFAQRLLEENKALRKTHNANVKVFAETSKEKAESELAAAKAKLKAAHESFDTDAIVDAQAEVAAAVQRVENAKNFRPTALQEEEEEVQPRQAQQQAAKPDQKSLNWQAENQWFGRNGNEAETSYALGLHQKLVNSGIDPRSDEYYEQINARMKSKFPELFEEEDFEDEEEKPKSGKGASARRPPPVVAASGSRSSTTPGKIRLTKTQMALAEKFGLTPQQYAAQVAKLQKDS